MPWRIYRVRGDRLVRHMVTPKPGTRQHQLLRALVEAGRPISTQELAAEVGMRAENAIAELRWLGRRRFVRECGNGPGRCVWVATDAGYRAMDGQQPDLAPLRRARSV